MSATAGVNVKMGVSGVQQFKQAMKESQAAVKTLDAELKLNEQNLKANGDAQQYMETKTRLLQEQIRMQTDVVNQSQKALEAMAKNGVKESSTAFQQMKQQSLAAQAQLVQLQNELDGVGTSGYEAANELSGIGNQLDSINRNTSWENVSEGIDKLTGKLQAAGRAAFEMGKKIVQATLSGGQWADDLQTTADQWEMTPEQVYRMQQTANLIDTSAETIFSSRKKLLAAMGKDSDKETMGAFAALGITDLSGTDKNIEDVFWKAGEALMGFEDKVARNEYATKLFGRSWEEMIPIFKAGRKGYEDTMNSWTWMGDEQFDKLTKMDDEQQKLNTEWENFQHQFEAAIAPALTEVMGVLQNLLHEFNTYLSSEDGQKMLQELGEAVTSLFGDLKEIKPEDVMKKIKEALDGVRNGFNWIIENKGKVKTAIEVIAAGFGLLKLGGLAANVARIVSGFKGLGGLGGAGSAGGAAGAAGAAGASNLGLVLKAASVNLVAATVIWQGIRSAPANTQTKIDEVMGFDTTMDKLFDDFNEKRGIKTMGDKMDEISQTSQATNQRAMNTIFDTIFNPGSRSGEPIYNPFVAPDQQTMGGGSHGFDLPEGYELPSNWLEATDDMTERTTESSNAMTEAAKGMTTIPTEMATAVEKAVVDGMSHVTIVVTEGAIDAFGRHNNQESGTALLNY